MSSSSSSERAHSQETCSTAVEWPFEHFPAPPPDGYWIPKSGPPPRPIFSSPFPDSPSNLAMVPPIMAPTYPPQPPLSEEDPTWLHQMFDDILRQRTHLERCLSETQTQVTNAYAEVGLADAELREERDLMQAFLDTVSSVAGSGFVRRMLKDVEQSVEVMSKSWDDPPSSGPAHSVHETAV